MDHQRKERARVAEILGQMVHSQREKEGKNTGQVQHSDRHQNGNVIRFAQRNTVSGRCGGRRDIRTADEFKKYCTSAVFYIEFF